MKKEDYKLLLEEAKKVLEKNHEVYFTKPSSTLYPNQYNWDSGFIAIGYSNYDQERAEQEIITLFQGQWRNGMLPHVVYNKARKTGAFPNREFWKISSTKESTKTHTSGITQPPIHATACKIICENAKDKDKAMGFLEYIYPRLLKCHQYLYNKRDPKKEGLVYIRHPWESGIDNSPLWDGIINTIHLDKPIKYKRTDIKQKVPLKQRPTNKEYDTYVRLIELFKKNKYDEKIIFKKCPFIVQDALFNSILNRANKDLLWIAKKVGEPRKKIKEWIKTTSNAIKEKLWDPRDNIFDSFNMISKKRIASHSVTGFAPLYSQDCTRKQARKIYSYIESGCFGKKNKIMHLPTWDTKRKEFRKFNYWRGPVWINTNWIIAQGLLNYKYKKKAATIIRDSIELVNKSGFYEYFDPFTKKGYGSKKFSWTAALTIEMLYNHFKEQI